MIQQNSSGPFFLDFIFKLRERGLSIGLGEVKSLAFALDRGLHQNSFSEFYFLARSLLVHDETKFDDYDQVFAHVFRGVPLLSKDFFDSLSEWLQDPVSRDELSKVFPDSVGTDEIKKLLEDFRQRLLEQTERHDGGNHWIGTGGTSRFGYGGSNPAGLSLRPERFQGAPGGGKSVLRLADARKFAGYRSDLVLDVRNIEVALRKLRILSRDDGELEFDLEGSVNETAKNLGELEVRFEKKKKSNTRVILMMDVGGSMDPHSRLVSQLFSAAKRASHWRELRSYYFHNCIYGQVYRTEGLRDPISIKQLLSECNERYRLIMLGDAAMAPYELLNNPWSGDVDARLNGIDWLISLRRHFQRSAWLNPDIDVESAALLPTVSMIASVFPMYPLSIAGIEEALSSL